MWHNYSPANQPDTIFCYMQESLSVMMQKHDDGFFYVSCPIFGIVNRKIEHLSIKTIKRRAMEIVQEAAAKICNICNEAIAKIV